MIGLHNHVDEGSNIRIRDCNIKVENLIKRANEIGWHGVAITDHESVSAHINAIQTVKKLKEKEKLPKDFKLILGNEIYLVDSLEEVRDNYKSGETKFYHFILLAKDLQGHRQLRELSSTAWHDNYFRTGIAERVPTIKNELERVVKKNKGHLVASTACLGGEFANLVLKFMENHTNEVREEIQKFIYWCKDVFGEDNFFIELQPSLETQEQITFNKIALEIAKKYNVKWIITTDSHYLTKEDRLLHKSYLNSQEGEREIDDFYGSTYLMTEEEIKGYMSYMNPDDIQQAFDNTMSIGDMIEEYDLYHPVIVPQITPPAFELEHLFAPAYDQFEYIKNFAYSDEEQDRYLLKLVEEGFRKKLWTDNLTKEDFYIALSRINIEFSELWEISKTINNNIPSYYITTRKIIEIMWNEGDSLVGTARGSVTGFLIAYLIDITQVNPLKWNLPHWRHLHKERPELPDIDIDSQQSRREQILTALKSYFGEDRVLNICTFGTEGSKSAIQTASRGLGIDNDTAQYIADLIPVERGKNWTLSECLYGDEEKGYKPIREFINEVAKYPNLLEVAISIEGLVNKRSIHASGIYIFNNHYVEQNALMRAPNGTPTTQWSMEDSDYAGGLKVDALTIQALDKIRLTMDMLIKKQSIYWQGNLKDTYDKYLHPDVLDYDTTNMWKMIGNNEITDLFQFDTEVGLVAAQKVKPMNLWELAITNSLMRLMADSGEQPVDTYVKFKRNIALWYQEMESYGLTQEEIVVLEKHLLFVYGVADTQEIVMELGMDSQIANFSIKEANKLRKGISKKKAKVIEEAKQMFFSKGKENNTSEALLNYVWYVQIARQLGYSFSKNHTLPYSMIALQEMNLAYHYSMLYWNTACLTVNAGADEDNENNQGTNYGKIATAIGNMQQRGVSIDLPNINEADFGFKANEYDNEIIFGLKGIHGIGDDIVQEIINLRPFKSFNDFIEKTQESSIKQNHIIKLIKAGCFDTLESKSREHIARDFAMIACEPKAKLTLANLPMIIDYNLLPEEYDLHVRIFKFKKYLDKLPSYDIIEEVKGKEKKIDTKIELDNISTEFFCQYFSQDCVLDVKNNNVVISEKKLKKEYETYIDQLKEFIAQPQTLHFLNEHLFQEFWNKYFEGTISTWEMDSISFYYHDHELIHVDKNKYGIVNFNELPAQPKIVGTYMSRGKERLRFELYRICGTVLDKNKTKHYITLLTPDGVVTVKFYGGHYGFYDKQLSSKNESGKKTVLENSWFTRGNKLMVTGYRRDNQFRPLKYSDSIYQHTVCLIDKIDEEGNLYLTTERTRVDNE